jgi:hypothetical protein
MIKHLENYTVRYIRNRRYGYITRTIYLLVFARRYRYVLYGLSMGRLAEGCGNS